MYICILLHIYWTLRSNEEYIYNTENVYMIKSLVLLETKYKEGNNRPPSVNLKSINITKRGTSVVLKTTRTLGKTPSV